MSPSSDGHEHPRWRHDNRVLFRDGPGGVVVILAPGNSPPRSMRGAGAALWAAFDEPRTVEEVAVELAEIFGTDPEAVRRDITPVVEQLIESGALGAGP